MKLFKKDNIWAYGVAALYITFVIGTMAFVISTFSHKVDLVRVDYYENDLLYSDQMARIENTALLEHPLAWTLTDRRTVMFQFPADFDHTAISGEIHFFRPSDSDFDRRFAIAPDTDKSQTISIPDAPHGYWRVKVLWKNNETEYYNEGPFFFH